MSDDEFTPTEWEVRDEYAAGNIHAEAEFDRMIAGVERAAAARALEEAADEIFVPHAEFDPGKRMAFHRGADAVYDALRARAAEIREWKETRDAESN